MENEMEFLRWLKCYYKNTFEALMTLVTITGLVLLSFVAPTLAHLLLMVLFILAVVFVGAIFRAIYLILENIVLNNVDKFLNYLFEYHFLIFMMAVVVTTVTMGLIVLPPLFYIFYYKPILLLLLPLLLLLRVVHLYRKGDWK